MHRTGVSGAAAVLLALAAAAAANEIPIQISVKFILNAETNRPPSGEFHTDEQVRAQIDRANQIYAAMGSEFRHRLMEIREVTNAHGFYMADTDSLSSLHVQAKLNPDQYLWRFEALNVYVTAASDSAIAYMPPQNDMIMVCQSIYDTTLAHEVGHSMNLLHTHDSSGDGCTDTLPDNKDWTNHNQVAQHSYGLDYAQLTYEQRQLVDNTWKNLMSYHDGDYRSVVTPQQSDRESARGYVDRGWLLGKIPVYVEAGAEIVPFQDMGSFTYPYPTIQDAMDEGETEGRALVLKAGLHQPPTGVLETRTDIINRRGDARVEDRAPAYHLPYNLEDSTNTTVRAAVRRAQALDRDHDIKGIVQALKEAAAAAEGLERDSLELEIARRLRDAGEFVEAERWFRGVAERTDQPALRSRCLRRSSEMLRRERQRRDGEQAAPGLEMEEETP